MLTIAFLDCNVKKIALYKGGEKWFSFKKRQGIGVNKFRIEEVLMKRLNVLLLVTVLVVAIGATVLADGSAYVYDDLNISQIESFFYSVSYSISFIRGTASDGTPYWRITDRHTGIKLLLIVYDLDSNNADEFESLEFIASFTLSPVPSIYRINAWNDAKRFGKAYLDKDGDPMLEFDLDVNGSTKDAIVTWMEKAIRITRSFAEYIGYL